MKEITYPGDILELAEVVRPPKCFSPSLRLSNLADVGRKYTQTAKVKYSTTVRFIANNMSRIFRLKKGDRLIVRNHNLFVCRR